MVSSPASSAREHRSGIGTVFADIVVSNKRDEILAEAGHLAASAIRREPIEQVLVDTGASTLCLPRDVIERLGLPVKRTVVAITATGEVETTVHEQANLSVAGRSGVVECIALPEGSRPLLGSSRLKCSASNRTWRLTHCVCSRTIAKTPTFSCISSTKHGSH